MTVTVKVQGFKELEAELEKLSRAAGKGVLRRAGIKALEPMAQIARTLAPDDPATPPLDLKTSIAVSSRAKIGRAQRRLPESRSSVNVYMGPTGAGYPQAIMQEFGTSHHGPQPYMRPAWDQDKNAMLDRLKAELWAQVRKSVARAERKAARQAGR